MAEDRKSAPGATVSPSEERDELDESGSDAIDDVTDAFAGPSDDSMDNMTDGDRQLTTNSDAIDSGLNDSDLGECR